MLMRTERKGNRFGFLKRGAAVLAAIVLLFAGESCIHPAAAETLGKQAYYAGAAQISGYEYYARGECGISCMVSSPLAGGDSWQEEIRYWPFDAETGLYATGAGEPAGDRVTFLKWAENNTVFQVRLIAPGKYTLCGVPFYVMDSSSEQLTAITGTIEKALDKARGKTNLATAGNLYTWLLKNVNSVFPADREAELTAACADPINCLLTGYACRETYAELYRMLLRYAGIESILVKGTVGTEAGEYPWVMYRTETGWMYADPGTDDINNKNGKKYNGKTTEEMAKDHILSDDAEQFVRSWVVPRYLDGLMDGDMEQKEQLRYENGYADVIHIVGKGYSLGPSGPVKVQIYRDSPVKTKDSEQIRKNLLNEINCWNRQDWIDEEKGYYTNGERAGDYVTLLDWNEDGTEITVSFNAPGFYGMDVRNGGFYVLDPEHPDQVKAAEVLDKMLENCQGESERDTAWNLYSRLAGQVTYDHEEFLKMKKFEGHHMENIQNPVSMICRGKGVCEGYSVFYKFLLESAGIHAMYLAGMCDFTSEMPHAWNIARIDGKWLYFDATWDDYGKRPGKKYFALNEEKFSKTHKPDNFTGEILGRTVVPGCYDTLITRFRTDYTPFAGVPAAVKVLKTTAREYGAPSSIAELGNPIRDLTEEELKLVPSGKTTAILTRQYEESVDGFSWAGYTRDAMRQYTYTVEYNSRILELTAASYDLLEISSPDTSTTEKTFLIRNGIIEQIETRASVPMRINEVKGYGKNSRRIWTYDEGNKLKAFTTSLVNDQETVEVTAHFDSEGKTSAHSIKWIPAGEKETVWTTANDGHVRYLRYMKNSTGITLQELTDKISWETYRSFRSRINSTYPGLIAEDGSLADPEVHLYNLSVGDKYRFAGTVFAVKDELLIWNKNGNMEINPDAKDILGNPVHLTEKGFDPDLSKTERLGF